MAKYYFFKKKKKVKDESWDLGNVIPQSSFARNGNIALTQTNSSSASAWSGKVRGFSSRTQNRTKLTLLD